MRFFRQTRWLHKWIGLASFLFVLILSLSGLLLMHVDSLELSQRKISGKFLPDKYFEVAASYSNIQSLAVIDTPQGERRILAGAGHGLFRSTDSGGSWVSLKDGLFNLDMRAIAAAAANPEILYAGTAKGVFKSEDGGGNWLDWFQETNGLDNTVINDLAVHPENPEVVFAATRNGLYASRNGGEYWEAAFKGGALQETHDIRAVRFSANNRNVLYAGTGRGVFRSADGGKTWDKKWEPLGNETINDLASLATDPEFLYAGTEGGLFKSFNQGVTWVKDKGISGSIHSIAVNAARQSQIAVAASTGVYLSLNGGDSWQKITPVKSNSDRNKNDLPGIFHRVRLGPAAGNMALLLAGTEKGLFISSDLGARWIYSDTSAGRNRIPEKERQMDLAKLVTEIHNGRFFGSYSILLVDLTTAGLIILVVSGLHIAWVRERVKRKKKVAQDSEVDALLNLSAAAESISSESKEIHDMIEHIQNHVQKCKTIYNQAREKKEVDEINKHITTLDKKMHHLIEHIGDIARIPEE